jgi:hypothetical protein
MSVTDEDIREIKESLRGVHGRLDGISTDVAALAAREPLHIEVIAKHDDAINSETTGLRPRLLRLESTVGLMTWGLRAAWGIIVSLGLMLAYLFFGGT